MKKPGLERRFGLVQVKETSAHSSTPLIQETNQRNKHVGVYSLHLCGQIYANNEEIKTGCQVMC